ncbi:hypothetical protein Y032_0101g3358 [Ancylostoma ceylanicum]|uniref:Uncharacterized protein n=1 Tax=Ancylostoma ceylanicum TaxID=53326 RepID=A0A016TGV8_9BILA|nr:hypothetical protein Y032_0101g3358 [Ancylostoma ceylanicum]
MKNEGESYDCQLEANAYEFARRCSLTGSSENSRPNEGENHLVAPFDVNPTQVGIRVSEGYDATGFLVLSRLNSCEILVRDVY